MGIEEVHNYIIQVRKISMALLIIGLIFCITGTGLGYAIERLDCSQCSNDTEPDQEARCFNNCQYQNYVLFANLFSDLGIVIIYTGIGFSILTISNAIYAQVLNEERKWIKLKK